MMLDCSLLPSPREVAKLLDGEASGSHILCPGPGHSKRDRSLSVTIDPNAPDGFIVWSFAGQDHLACKDHVRHLLALPEFGSRRAIAPIDHEAIARRRADAEARASAESERQISKARWLWSQTQPPADTIVETYLRVKRKLGIVPPTLRFLPAREAYPPSMVAGYGVPQEQSEPGTYDVLPPDAIRAVHLTRLLPDGSDRERGSNAKIMIGRPAEWPIALIPVNDLGGLLIAEGVETALSYAHLGLGIWAAGAKDRLPAIAPTIAALPCVEVVTISPDEDDPAKVGTKTSRVRAEELAERLIELRPDIELRIA